MKKLVYILVLFAGIAKAQIVNIPDANFKSLLLSITPESELAYGNGDYIKVDANDNGEIELLEAQSVDSLKIFTPNNVEISDLTGISSFSNLKMLYSTGHSFASLDLSSMTSLKQLHLFYNYTLTSLNLSMLPNLEIVDCRFNSLNAINVSGLANLKNFYCDNNNLSSLNLSGLISLQSFSCSHNNLTFLNLTGSPNLYDFDCNSNHLTSLDVNNLSHLVFLRCYSNQLTALNLSGLTALGFLDVDDNQLTALDVSQLHSLDNISCGMNLFTTLDFSHCQIDQLFCYDNPNLQSLFLKDGRDLMTTGYEDTLFTACPNLRYICIDESESNYINNVLTTNGLTAIVAGSYCTFTPGGNYNTISGTITFDANNNGCDAGDIPRQNIRVNINDGFNEGATFINSTGQYAFYTQDGDFEITPATESPTFFNFSPPTATISFADNNNNISTQNFCISANGIHPDVEVVIAPITPARPGFEAGYMIVYKNKGNQTLSGNVTFAYNDAVLDFVSSTVIPNSQATGLLTYNYSNLMPFESRSFYITLHVNAPTDSPAVNIGDQLNFTAVINPIPGDETPPDNTFPYHQTVTDSFDPNDITCIEGSLVPPTEIGNYLHYIINFENTGTADAENIVVKDIIDTTQFDVNSLQVLNSSAEVTAKLTGNVAEFIFPNINLHSGGHGNILIKIRSKNTLVQGNMVSKRANIYFDYNAPIDTNLENTTFQLLSNPNFDVDKSISVYPNPSHGNVTISCDNSIKSIQLYDIQGRLLQTSLVNENQTTVEISSQANGIYFIKVISDKGILVQKIIRE